jgi:D-amino acid aminotransferase
MRPPICFLNGKYVETANATISALDRGFLFGEGLFETWRTYKGRPFALREHLARMAKSARALGIPLDVDEDWEGRTRRLARLNGLDTRGGAIRFTITRGPGPISLIPQEIECPTQLMLFRPLEPGLEGARADGVGIHLLDFGAGVNARLRQVKSLNYLPAIIGKVEANRRNCFESLYELADGTVLEGTTSNFFVLKKGTLATTPVASGILPGVTRATVIRLARRVAPVVERRITVEDLLSADELFLTSSTIEVVPIIRVGRRTVAGGRVGDLTRELQIRYRRNVARSFGVTVDDLGE